MNENYATQLKAIPCAPDWRTGYDALNGTMLSPIFSAMSRTPQNPRWHSEDDVFSHTKLVLKELSGDKRYRLANDREQLILFTAALLHDIGKTRCTRLENGVLISPYHSKTGAVMARELLWREFGLCGSDNSRSLRETVCFLI